jgi:choice-of-anchor A domain-containing protein
MRFRLRRVWHLTPLALVAASLHAQTSTQALTDDLAYYSQDLAGYNLVALTNATLGAGSTTQGGVYVGSDLTVSGSATVASSAWSLTSPSLYVGGSGSAGLTVPKHKTLTVTNGSAEATAITGWTYGSNTLSSSNGSVALPSGSADPLTNSAATGFNLATDNLATVTTNLDAAGTTSGASFSVTSGALTFTPPAGQTSGVVVFDMTPSSLSGVTKVVIDIPAGLNYVINMVVSSNTTLLSGASFQDEMGDNRLLWNFETSSNTITLGNSGTFYGSILATDATIADSATTVSGQIVANTFTESNSNESLDANPLDVLVPEPSTYGLWALGLCGLGIAFRLRPSARRARG